MTSRHPNFDRHVLIDTTPMPSGVPSVPEIGSTSAPLLSAAYFIGARCRDYNDDYMQCKTEAGGKGEFVCMKEGRKVTRCAASVLDDINKSCLEEFRAHWTCLEDWNHQLWQCRKPERRLNKCVFEKIGLEKTIPDAPAGEKPVHLRQKQIFATLPQHEIGHPEGPWIPDPPRPFHYMTNKMKEMMIARENKYNQKQPDQDAKPAQS